MNIFNRLNKRRRKLLLKIIRNFRLRDLSLSYIFNRISKLLFNPNKQLDICHPTNGMIELGNVCNLHCNMCPREHEYGKQMDIGFMPYNKAIWLIDQMVPYMDSIGLTGLGETFLYPRLLEIVKYIKHKKRNIIITLSTNANFNNYLEKVKPILPYIDNIQFSVDGIENVYDNIRHSTFQQLSNNIQKTMEWGGNNVEYMINCVVSKENINNLIPIVDFAGKLGIEFVNFNLVSIATMPNVERSYYDIFKSKEFDEVRNKVYAEASKYEGMEVTGMQYPENPSFKDCIYPWEYPYITWDGYYVPCCGKPFPKLLNFGNVFYEGDVMKVLNSEKAKKFRHLWQINKAPSFCHNCQLTNI